MAKNNKRFENSLTILFKIPFDKWSPYAIIALFGCIYLTIIFCNHHFFRTFCFDYGVYNFAFYDYAHFRISDCPIYFVDKMNFLQDHLSFTFMLFIPFFWLFGWLTGTYTLLIIQVFIILWGGLAVYRLIELKTSDRMLSMLALLQYFIIYGRWTMFDADCNLAIIASSMIPVFLYYFEKKSFITALLVLSFILITREDMALWTLFIGIFLFIRHFKEKNYQKLSLYIIVLSVIYFVFVFSLIIPALETEQKKYTLFQYSAMGKGPWEALKFVLSNPVQTIKLFFVNQSGNPYYDGIKFEFYYVYFLCGGFLLLYRPVYLLLFIPILAKKMLNDEPLRWSTDTYYSVEFISILPVAVFMIISEIKRKLVKIILIGIVSIGTIGITVYKSERHKDSSVFWYDDKHAFYKSKMYKSELDIQSVNHQLGLIPQNAAVSATGTIVPHIAWRSKIYNFPKVSDAEYIAVFTKRDTYPLNREQFNEELKKYHSSPEWKSIFNDSSLLILKRVNRKKEFLEPK
jgi:uncharacterized membrane protein